MSPYKKIEINNNIIEKFYWHGRPVVYINNLLFDGTYEEAIKSVSIKEKQNEKFK